MYHIAYFQQRFNDINTKSFITFQQLIDSKQIYQPIIFCDSYNIEAVDIPIFHSSYIDQHYHKRLILTDMDQITYIQNFHHNNFILMYNSIVITPSDNKYKYIDMEHDLATFLNEHCNEYKTI